MNGLSMIDASGNREVREEVVTWKVNARDSLWVIYLDWGTKKAPWLRGFFI
jgi:hypothetical protein